MQAIRILHQLARSSLPRNVTSYSVSRFPCLAPVYVSFEAVTLISEPATPPRLPIRIWQLRHVTYRDYISVQKSRCMHIKNLSAEN